MRQGGVLSGIRCTLPIGNDRSASRGQAGVWPAPSSTAPACDRSDEKKTSAGSKTGEGANGSLGRATCTALDVVKRVQGVFWQQDLMGAL